MKEFIEEYIMYLRKSRSDNPNESVEEVLSRHEKQLQELAVRLTGKPLDEKDIYREIISGGEEIENRPAFMQVLRRMERGDIKGVLVIDTQRLSRSGIYGAGDILNAFEFTNTLICTPNKTYNLDDKYDKKFLEMEMIQSSDYLNYTKEILARGRLHSFNNGCYIGSTPPFGYDREKLKREKGYKLVINEKEAEIVKMMYELFLESLGTVQLANYMNKIGLKTRNGNPWTPVNVRKILTNPTYHGELIFGRRKTTRVLEDGKIVKKVLSNDKPMLVKGKHEPIVSKEQFEQAQEKFKSHPSSKVPRSYEIKNSLAGLVTCKECGRTMVRKLQSGEAKIREKRIHEITEKEKEEISKMLRKYKADKKMSLTELSKALNVSKSQVDIWFSKKLDRVYFSKEFAKHWFELKKVLEIKEDKYDKMITEYHRVRDVEHLICITFNCSTVGTPLRKVEYSILNALEGYLRDYKYFLDNYEEEIVRDARNNEKTLNMIDRKIEKLKKEKKNALRNYNAEDMTREEYLEIKSEIEEELKELEEQKQIIEESEENDKVTKYKKAIPILSKCINEYHTLSIAEKNDLLKSIIEKVVYSKTGETRWKRNNSFDLELFMRI